MQTEPPPRANFCETVNQWVIYDSYVAYETAKEVAEEKEMKKEQKEVKSMRRRLLETPKENSNDEVNKRMLRAAKILERMVNQNTYDEIAQGNISIIYYQKDSNSNGSYKKIFFRFPFLRGCIGRVPRVRGHAAAAVEVRVREGAEAGDHGAVLEPRLQRPLRRGLRVMWVTSDQIAASP